MEIRTIRPKSQKDFNVSVDLLNEIFSEFPDFKPYTTEFAYNRTKGKNPLILEVYDNEQIIAYALCYDRIKGYLHIWDIGTKKAFRGKGIASKIYDHIEKYAKVNNYQGVTLNTFNRFANNIRLLLARGYEIFDIETKGEFKNDPKIHMRLKFK